jgi:hypothetical protein
MHDFNSQAHLVGMKRNPATSHRASCWLRFLSWFDVTCVLRGSIELMSTNRDYMALLGAGGAAQAACYALQQVRGRSFISQSNLRKSRRASQIIWRGIAVTDVAHESTGG